MNGVDRFFFGMMLGVLFVNTALLAAILDALQ